MSAKNCFVVGLIAMTMGFFIFPGCERKAQNAAPLSPPEVLVTEVVQQDVPVRATKAGVKFRTMALDDSDLEPLWSELRGSTREPLTSRRKCSTLKPMKNAGISTAIVQDIIFLSGPDQAAFGGLDPAEMGPAILQPF
jgi:hypothetical protein